MEAQRLKVWRENMPANDYRPQKGMSPDEQAALIEAIMAEATLAEKVGMMSGKGFFKAFMEDDRVWAARPYRAGGGIERLGVPAFWFTDGPRGVARGNSTCFPCSMARGASFDPDLEYRIGQVMGIEARAQGCNLSGAVCFNLLRHPAWGRAQETYGEDSYHLGVMGSALGLGIQSHNVCATVKHFALNSMENARFTVDVQIDERTLHEIYLPHFKYALDAGVASVMSAYNKMNGEYCGQNAFLLTDILRGEWGFEGFVHSDWVKGVYDPYGAAAGLDVENPEPLVFGDKLVAAVETGEVEAAAIDRAGRRILQTLYRFACAEDPLPDYPIELVASEPHRMLALEAAEKSAVLLKNDGLLPLDPAKTGKIAVLGKLASMENTGDNGSSRVRPPYIITALEGLQRRLGTDRILTGDEDDLTAASNAAAEADVAVIIVGNTAVEEGEYIPGDMNLGQGVPDELRDRARSFSLGGDRDQLGLKDEQIALIRAAAQTGKPIIVVLISGSAIIVEEWHDEAQAILQTFYSGMEGGTALANLLFGDVSPSGKLPFTVARDASHYPFFDKNAERIRYDYWHGYALFDRDQIVPRYAFGHGLSYTAFGYGGLGAEDAGDTIKVRVDVTNSGTRDATEVAQLYVGAPGIEAIRWPKALAGFQRVTLAADETRTITFHVPKDQLRWRDPETHVWRLERGDYRIAAGGASDRLFETRIIL
jgi:beta-glucosidase